MTKRQQITLGIRLKTDGLSRVDPLKGALVVIARHAIQIRIGEARAIENQTQVVAIPHGKILPGRLRLRLLDNLDRGCLGDHRLCG